MMRFSEIVCSLWQNLWSDDKPDRDGLYLYREDGKFALYDVWYEKPDLQMYMGEGWLARLSKFDRCCDLHVVADMKGQWIDVTELLKGFKQ